MLKGEILLQRRCGGHGTLWLMLYLNRVETSGHGADDVSVPIYEIGGWPLTELIGIVRYHGLTFDKKEIWYATCSTLVTKLVHLGPADSPEGALELAEEWLAETQATREGR
jgi:hypothetical protein